jgi:hypothetical protein
MDHRGFEPSTDSDPQPPPLSLLEASQAVVSDASSSRSASDKASGDRKRGATRSVSGGIGLSNDPPSSPKLEGTRAAPTVFMKSEYPAGTSQAGPLPKQEERLKMECGCKKEGRNLIVCIDGTSNRFGDKVRSRLCQLSTCSQSLSLTRTQT